MKTKKLLRKRALLEVFLIMLPTIGIAISALSIIIKKESFEYLGFFGLALFALPVFISQFLLPSKIIEKVSEREIKLPRFGEIMLYTIIFPMSNLFLLLILDAVVGIIPNNDPCTINAKVLIISATTYILMVGSGLLYARKNKV